MNDTALTKELVAICMMNGVVIWVEKDRIGKLEALFALPRAQWPQFIDVEGQKVNPSRVEGIFTAAAMEEAQRRKNGEWMCKEEVWHDRFEKCACVPKDKLKATCEKAAAFYIREGHMPLWAPSTSEIRRVLGPDALQKK